MKLPIVAAVSTILLGAAHVLAQGSIVGTYKGSFPIQTNLGSVDVGVTLAISSVEDGKVKGTATYHRGPCAGDYPVEGVLRGNVIGVRATAKGGRAGDCYFGFKGTVDGNRLVGSLGKYELELRK